MKNCNHNRNMAGQVAVGIVIIGIGVLFLLNSLGIIAFHQAITFWPVALIALGAYVFFDRSPHSRMVGGLFVAIGSVILLKRLGILDVRWQTLWPLGIIVVGALVLYAAVTGRKALSPATLMGEPAGEDVVHATAILGGFERRITTPAFRGGEVTAILGGCALDMRGSSIQGEAVLNVFAAFGGITIKCPPDWTVVLHGTPILGGFEEKTATPPDNSKRLIVTGYAIFGGVEVRN